MISSLMSLAAREACSARCALPRQRRKAAANLAGATGFHRHIEREHVGPPSDLVDDGDDLGNFLHEPPMRDVAWTASAAT